MREHTPGIFFNDILQSNAPHAIARMRGNAVNPQLNGIIKFYDTPYGGVLIEAEIFGLPDRQISNQTGFYAMHIHEKGDCTLPFNQTGEHYSKIPTSHPEHSGDLLPLFGNQGFAWEVFYNSRISVKEVEGRSVIIHAKPDDFTTQPSGNAGDKIGCGVIRRNLNR